jgi:hypothetical protein
LRGVVTSHSFAFRASRRLKFSYKSIENACTAFPSTLVSKPELSPPLQVFLLLRVGRLSRLNTRAILAVEKIGVWDDVECPGEGSFVGLLSPFRQMPRKYLKLGQGLCGLVVEFLATAAPECKKKRKFTKY